MTFRKAIPGFFLASLALHVFGCWADGWDYSVFEILRGGKREFDVLSITAVLFYAASAGCLGLSMELFRQNALRARGGGPVIIRSMGIESRNYGCTLIIAAVLIFGSIPLAIGLCIWQFIAKK